MSEDKKHREPTRDEFIELLAMMKTTNEALMNTWPWNRPFITLGVIKTINEYLGKRLPEVLYERG